MAFPLLLSRYKSLERGGILAYWQKVLNLAPSNLIGYWRLNETSGTNANDSSSQNNDGTYTGVELANAAGPDGVLVPLWDGANDYCNIYSAALNTDFNGTEGSIAIWIKVSAVGVWADGTSRKIFHLGAGADYIYIARTTTANQIQFAYRASGGGALFDAVAATVGPSTAWIHLALTWSHVGGDELIAYVNGAQTGTTQTGLAGWVNALTATGCNLGSYDLIPTQVWSGWLAHAALWTTPLTPAQILSLATV